MEPLGVGERPGGSGTSRSPEEGRPRCVILAETKLDQKRLECFWWKLDMPNMIVKNCEGQSGGLAVFWKREIQLRVVGFISRYHIDMEIIGSDGFVW
jgi:hypothetical protein